ncbi:hypothetical protein BSQ39_09710 [Loigolactobacillus backii]|uniref:MBG domain-containing protein n=1 Tax=Loigolactobacillus backii TaxID=375175 RepID=UPI000C1C8D86|nr:MBG domain-containing protein [Loigolactobacillus backii]PIO83824.1 hypothetical protein BSQ39_09710 [Loigolactobacillus backii]
MRRYNYRDMLISESKTHYKMYKAKKQWVAMGMTAFGLSLGAFVANPVTKANAATVPAKAANSQASSGAATSSASAVALKTSTTASSAASSTASSAASSSVAASTNTAASSTAAQSTTSAAVKTATNTTTQSTATSTAAQSTATSTPATTTATSSAAQSTAPSTAATKTATSTTAQSTASTTSNKTATSTAVQSTAASSVATPTTTQTTAGQVGATSTAKTDLASTATTNLTDPTATELTAAKSAATAKYVATGQTQVITARAAASSNFSLVDSNTTTTISDSNNTPHNIVVTANVKAGDILTITASSCFYDSTSDDVMDYKKTTSADGASDIWTYTVTQSGIEAFNFTINATSLGNSAGTASVVLANNGITEAELDYKLSAITQKILDVGAVRLDQNQTGALSTNQDYAFALTFTGNASSYSSVSTNLSIEVPAGFQLVGTANTVTSGVTVGDTTKDYYTETGLSSSSGGISITQPDGVGTALQVSGYGAKSGYCVYFWGTYANAVTASNNTFVASGSTQVSGFNVHAISSSLNVKKEVSDDPADKNVSEKSDTFYTSVLNSNEGQNDGSNVYLDSLNADGSKLSDDATYSFTTATRSASYLNNGNVAQTNVKVSVDLEPGTEAPENVAGQYYYSVSNNSYSKAISAVVTFSDGSQATYSSTDLKYGQIVLANSDGSNVSNITVTWDQVLPGEHAYVTYMANKVITSKELGDKATYTFQTSSDQAPTAQLSELQLNIVSAPKKSIINTETIKPDGIGIIVDGQTGLNGILHLGEQYGIDFTVGGNATHYGTYYLVAPEGTDFVSNSIQAEGPFAQVNLENYVTDLGYVGPKGQHVMQLDLSSVLTSSNLLYYNRFGVLFSVNNDTLPITNTLAASDVVQLLANDKYTLVAGQKLSTVQYGNITIPVITTNSTVSSYQIVIPSYFEGEDGIDDGLTAKDTFLNYDATDPDNTTARFSSGATSDTTDDINSSTIQMISVNGTSVSSPWTQNLITLPSIDNGDAFNLVLTGAVDQPTVQNAAGDAQILYSTQSIKAVAGQKVDQSSFVTADKITDWSTVRSILVVTGSLVQGDIVIAQLPVAIQNINSIPVDSSAIFDGTFVAENSDSTISQMSNTMAAKVIATSNVTTEWLQEDANGVQTAIKPAETTAYEINDDYTTSGLLKGDIPAGYVLSATPTNATGTTGKDPITVTYLYVYQGQRVNIHYIDMSNYVENVPGADSSGLMSNLDFGTELTDAEQILTGNSGDTYSNTINLPTSYHLAYGSLDNDGTYDAGAVTGTYDTDFQNDQDFYVYVTEDMLTETPESNPDNYDLSKVVNETITYLYEDGTTAAANHTDHVTFTRTATKGTVTGNVKYTAWVATDSDMTFDAVTSPTIVGYTADQPTIAAVTDLTNTSDDVTDQVTYSIADGAIALGTATKVYDNDATTDPVYAVTLPTGIVAPTWTADDFTAPSSQDASDTAYSVNLSTKGLDDLKAANPNFSFTAAMITAGALTITPALITIAGPELTKSYDGKAYSGNGKVAIVSGVPANGQPPVYTLGDLSDDIDIGTYTIAVTADAAENGNYKITTTPGHLTITQNLEVPPENTPANPTNPEEPGKNPQLATSVVVQGATKTYDGDTSTDPTTYTVLAPSNYADFVIPDLTADDFDLSNLTSQNVGSYSLTLSASGLKKLQDANTNYKFDLTDVQNGLFVITPASITITAPTVSKTYDGQGYTTALTGDVTGVPDKGLAPDYSLTDVTGDKDVNDYPINVTTPNTADNSNYTITTAAGKLSITPASLEVTPPNSPEDPTNPADPVQNPQLTASVVVQGGTKVYDGDASTDPTTYTVLAPSNYPDFIVPDLTADDFDLSGIDSQNVGNYVVNLSASGLKKLQDANTNYSFDLTDVQNGLFVITQAPVTITAPTLNKTYDGQPYTGADDVAQVTGVPSNGVDLTYSLTDLSQDINADSYAIDVIATAEDNPNYKITATPGQLTITPQGLEVTPPNTPTNPTNPVDPGQNPQLTASVVVQGGTKTYDGDASTDPTTFTVLAPSNYADFVIPDLTAADFDLSDLNSQNVGNYVVTLNASGLKKLQAANTNYEFDATDVQNGLFAITPASITITAPTVSKTYDGQGYTAILTGTITGLPDKGLTPDYSLTDVSDDSAVNSYAINVTVPNTAGNSNYTITTTPGILTINPVVDGISVSLGTQQKLYDGDASTDPTMYQVSLSNGLVAPTWTAADFDFSGITSQNVGTYDVTLSAQGLSDLRAANLNYTITADEIGTGSFTITPAPITITAPTVSKTYDGKPYSGDLTATLIGVPTKGDQPVYSLTDVSADVAAGEYGLNVNADATANSNYTITTVAGKLTITPQGLDVTPPNTPTNPTNPEDPGQNPQLTTSVVVQGGTKVYDGDASTDPTTFTVLAPSDYADFVIPDLTADDFDLSDLNSQNVGNYVVNLSASGLQKLQAANPNYKFDLTDVQNGLFAITPAPITITAPSASKTYDGQPYTGTLTATVDGVPAKGLAPDYSLTNINGYTTVGDYDINVVTTNTADNSNYVITPVAGKLSITAAELDVTPPNTPENPTNPDDPGQNPQLATSVVVQGGTKVYDGDAATDLTTYTVLAPSKDTDFIIPDLTAADFDLSGIDSQNVGNYVVTLSASGLQKLQAANPNYKFDLTDVQNGLFVITPAPITITAPSASKTYDGQPYTGVLTATVDGVPSAGVTPVYSLADLSQDVNAGSYDINVNATASDNSNYTITTTPGTLTITPKGLDVTPPNTPETPTNPGDPGQNPQLAASVVVQGGTKVYDGDAATDQTTYTVLAPSEDTDFVVPDLTAADFDLSGINSQNVGNYAVTLNATGLQKLQAANPNYDFDNTNVQNGLFVITPAPVTITAPSVSKTYDGQAYSGKVTATVSGVPTKGSNVSYDLSDLSSDVAVGDYEIDVAADATANSNYTIKTKKGQLSITPAGLDVTPPNTPENPTNPADPGQNPQLAASVVVQGGTKVYDGDASTDPTTFTVLAPSKDTDFVVPDLTAADFDLSGIDSQNVGNYVVNLSASGLKKLQAANPNYDFDLTNVQNGLFAITPASITIKAPTVSKTYDGKAYSGAITATAAGVPASGVAPVYSLTDLSQDVNAGSYAINVTATASDNSNYKITTEPGQLTITPQGLDVTPPNTPANPTNPDDPSQNPQLTASVVVQGATKVYDGDASTDPTTYTVLAPSNYPDFVMPTLTASDFDLSDVNSQNVGNYSVTLNASGLKKLQDANPNYKFDLTDVQNGLFVITPAPITIKAPTVSKTYDGQGYTADLAATVAGVPTKGLAPDYSLTNVSGDAAVGSYVINVTTPNTADNGNYKITTNPGSLTVTPASLEVTPPNTPENPTNPDNPSQNPQLAGSVVVQGATKVYDGDASTDPTTYTVLAPSKDTNFVVPDLTAADFDLSGIDSQNVGNYAVTLNASGLKKLQAANPNYDFDATDVQNGLFVITPAAVTITAPSVSKTYDGQAYTGELKTTVSGVPTKGTSLNYTLSDLSKDTAVGQYAINVNQTASDNSNYKVSVVAGQLTITAATDYSLTTNYVDETGKQVATSDSKTDLSYGDAYTTTAKVVNGYYLTAVPSNAKGTIGKGDLTVTYVYNKVGSYVITPPNGGTETDVPYPNDPDNPGKVTTPTTPIVPSVPGETPVGPNGDPLTPAGDGYLPPATPADPGKDTTITYVANDYGVTVNYVDQNGKQVAPSETQTKLHDGDDYTTTAKVVNGYYLTAVPSNAKGTIGTSDLTVTYVYNKVGSYVITPPNGGSETDVPYPNDPANPGKVTTPTTPIVPSVPGETPVGPNGDPLTPSGDGYLPPATPADPGKDTTITYVANDYGVTVNYVDQNGKQVAPSETQTKLHDGDDYTTTAKVVNGYYLTAVPSNAKGTIGTSDLTVTYVYNKVGSYVITPPNGGSETDVPYPNDPDNPGKVTTPTTPIVPSVPGETPVGPDGDPLTPSGDGYLPPATPADPSTDTSITYTKDDQTATVTYIDDDTGQVLTSDSLTGKSGATITYSTAAKIASYTQKGYQLVSDGFSGTPVFDNDTTATQNFEVHFKQGQATATPANPGTPGAPVDSTNPDGPKWPDGTTETDLVHNVTETIHYVDNNGKTLVPDKVDTVTFTRTAVVNEVTGKLTYTPWTATNGDTSFDAQNTPMVSGYTPSQSTIAAVTGLTATSSDIVKTVVYAEQTAATPATPTTTPAKVVTPAVATPTEQTVTPTVRSTTEKTVPTAAKVTPKVAATQTVKTAKATAKTTKPVSTAAVKAATSDNGQKRLPQTGDAKEGWLAEVGLAMLGSIGLLGAAKRRKHDEDGN